MKVLFCTMWPNSLPDVTDEQGEIVPDPENAAKLLTFWEKQFEAGWWAKLIALARAKKYRELAAEMATVQLRILSCNVNRKIIFLKESPS